MLRSLMIPTLTAIACVTLPVAPAHADPGGTASARADAKEGRRACARRDRINGWSEVGESKRHVLLQSGTGTFLLTVTPRCYDLRFNSVVAIRGSGSNSRCVERGDVIFTRDRERCFITRIEEVENLEAAEALVAERAREEN